MEERVNNIREKRRKIDSDQFLSISIVSSLTPALNLFVLLGLRLMQTFGVLVEEGIYKFFNKRQKVDPTKWTASPDKSAILQLIISIFDRTETRLGK